MVKIPKFKSEQEEREFWDTHDFADYVDDTEPVTDAKAKMERQVAIITKGVDIRSNMENIEPEKMVEDPARPSQVSYISGAWADWAEDRIDHLISINNELLSAIEKLADNAEKLKNETKTGSAYSFLAGEENAYKTVTKLIKEFNSK